MIKYRCTSEHSEIIMMFLYASRVKRQESRIKNQDMLLQAHGHPVANVANQTIYT